MAAPRVFRLHIAHMLGFPPSLRASVHDTISRRAIVAQSNIPRRAFSATVRSKTGTTLLDNTFADLVCYQASNLLHGIHSAGVPWYAAIPLFAIAVRGIFEYHAAIRPAHRAAMTSRGLEPLISARAHSDSYQWMQRHWKTASDVPDYMRGSYLSLIYYRYRLLAAHQLGGWRGSPLVNLKSFIISFYTFVIGSEAIRRMCGAREGLLGMAMAPLEWLRKVNAGNAQSTTDRAPLLSKDEAIAEALQAKYDARTIAERGFDATVTSDLDTSASPMAIPQGLIDSNWIVPFESSLQSGGLPWCLDLTVADSTMILPFVLATTMLVRSFIPLPGSPPQPKGRFGILPKLNFERRLGLWASGLFFVLTLKMPAGVLLYLITSIMTSWLQKRWMNVRDPLPRPITSCARPLRMRVQRDVGDV